MRSPGRVSDYRSARRSWPRTAGGSGPRARASEREARSHSRCRSLRCRSTPRAEIPLEEGHDLRPRIGAVLRFGEPVPFVRVTQVLDRDSTCAEGRDDLLCLFDWNTRIIRTVDHHEWGPYPVERIDGRDRPQEIGIRDGV